MTVCTSTKPRQIFITKNTLNSNLIIQKTNERFLGYDNKMMINVSIHNIYFRSSCIIWEVDTEYLSKS